MRKILIIGATSAIAEATARIWARLGHDLFLVGRNTARLEAIAADLRVRGCRNVTTYRLDANDLEAHIPMLDAAEHALDGMDTVLIAHGSLADQAVCQASVERTISELKTNGLSVVALLTHIANRLEQKKSGRIVVISSVAGDRGRQSNYIYGSAKAMVNVFTSGLRQRLHKSGISVVTIKPGFVDTPMTRNFQKNMLWAQPGQIAASIVRATESPAGVHYAPVFWRLIMGLVRAVPETIFKRLSM